MLSLALLIVPGLALYSRAKKEFTLVELVAASIALSFVLLPFAAMLARPFGFEPWLPLGLLVIALLFRPGGKLKGQKQFKPLALALLFGLLVLAILSQYLAGPAVHPLHAADAVWHASNAALYSISPQFPPLDSYSPGLPLAANWAYTVLLGETNLHVVFFLAAIALFLSVYLIAEKLFKSGTAAAVLFTFFAGLSWLLQYNDTFWRLVYLPLNFKFDPTLVFFLLPQPQAIGFVLFAFALWLYMEKRPALLGITLAGLAGYQLQTAAVLFIALILHTATKRELPHWLPWFAFTSLPFLLPLATVHQSQFSLYFSTDALKTAALTVVPLAALAWSKRKTPFLPALAVLCVLLAVFVNIPLTWNGYRFLDYAVLPLAILASASLKKTLPAIVAVALCVSSIVLIGLFIGQSYQQAAPSEFPALQWIDANTPSDALFLEAYSYFPRVPYLGHRAILYGGYFGPAYHGWDGKLVVERITGETDPARVRRLLLENNIDYVFAGEREKALPFYPALSQFDEAYPGVFRVS